MASGDTSTEREVACPCGRGTLFLERTSWNNGWSRDLVEAHLACVTCSAIYQLEPWRPGDAAYELTRLDQLTANRKASTAWLALAEALRTKYLGPLAGRLAAHLRQQGSTRVRWAEALKALGLADEGDAVSMLARARRLDSYCAGLVSSTTALAIAAALGEKTPGLKEAIAAVARAEKAIPRVTKLRWPK